MAFKIGLKFGHELGRCWYEAHRATNPSLYSCDCPGWAALFSAYHHGETVKGNEWQAKWDKLDADDAQAKATNEATERTRTPEMGGQSFGWIRTNWGRCKDFMGARRSEITVGIYNAKLLIFIG